MGRESSDPCAREVKEATNLRPLRSTGHAGKAVVTKIGFISKCPIIH
jgi:hypothetical protein